MKKYTKTLYQDLSSRLPDVERVWLRRFATLIMFPFVFAILVVVGLFEGLINTVNIIWTDFLLDCWYGRN